MSLSDFSVRKPIFTTMITLIVVVLGAFSLRRLQIDLLPPVEMPTASVTTGFPGAHPEVVESQVTQIIEEIVSTVPGVEELSSSTYEGFSRVRVTFTWGTDIDSAALELQSRLEDEINELPEDANRPRVSKFDVNSFPVVVLGIASEIDPVELTEMINEEIRYRFARIPGVAQVDLWGGFNREIQVALDPDRLRALGVPLDRVLAALRDANLDLPSGRIETGRYEVTLRAPAQYDNLEQIRETALETVDGTVVTIGQIAEIRDTYDRPWRIERVNGVRGIRVAIRKQAEANTVEVSRAVLAEIEAVNRDFPVLNVVSVINQGNFIERSIANVARSVAYGGGLAIFVLLFFLRNLRITGVIALSIPISIIGTFALIYFGGFTLNLMTLGGLALGVGMMVDSSIVVLENIFRRRDEEHEVPALAASRGAREVGPAIIASTITTLVIFIPVIFVRGVTGLLFQDLAYVIVFSLVCSLLVALSLVPMLAARMILPREVARKRRGGWAQRLSERAGRSFEKMDTGYRRLLDRALRHRLKVVGGATALLGASFLLVPLIGSEFLPPSDEGEVGIYARMEIGTRAEIVDEAMRRVEAIVEEMVPERRADVVSIYEGRADIRLSLVPARERSRSNVEIADELRERLRGAIPGMEVFVSAPQGQFLLNRILDTNSGNGFDIEVRGRELDTLRALSEEVVETIRDIEGIVEVDASMESGLPQEELRIDRAKVAALGLSARDVTAALRTAVAGSDAGNFQEAGRSYEIMVQLADAESLSIDQVLDLVLSTPSGELVALRNLVETSSSRAPQEIERKDQQRYAEVDVSVSGRDIGSVAQEVQARLASIPRPAGYSFILAGSFEEQQEAFNELLFALVLALLLVYMVLACQYESLLNPLIVMISTPMAAIGVFVTLAATGTTFNLQSAIGCIMLGGIVVNNAILLVDQANRLEQEGWALDAAVAEAGRRRLRPILMTTATTILGLTPLALGFGEGADAQAPLARAVVGGLIGSTALTLILIPAVYSLAHSALGQRRAEELEATSAAAAR